MKNLSLNILEELFNEAKENNAKYIGVKIKMQGFIEPEVIINPYENFIDKLNYYLKAYNEDLTLKSFNGIKIIDCAYANNYNDLEFMLN